MKPIIFGVTATPGNPDLLREFLTKPEKDINGKPLAKYGFKEGFELPAFSSFSLTDVIKRECRYEEADYLVLKNKADGLRKEHGPHYLAQKVFEENRAKFNGAPILVTDIKNVSELGFFRDPPKGFPELNEYDFYLIALDSSLNDRWNIIQNRRQKGDPKSFEEFREWDKTDRGIGNKREERPLTTHVEKCIAKADAMIYYNRNETSILEFIADFFGLVAGLLSRRPKWDETFMDMAYSMAKRSTCISRQVGALIARENYVFSTGFNGAPRGQEHCTDKGYCPRIKAGIESGSGYEKCEGNHAEENAITNAARYGIPIEGAILYSTTAPCPLCAKTICNSGIREVVYSEAFHNNPFVEEKLNISHIGVRRFQGITHLRYHKIFDDIFFRNIGR